MVKRVLQDDANTAESLGLVQVTLLEGQFRHNAHHGHRQFHHSNHHHILQRQKSKRSIPTYVWQEEMELTLVGLQVQREFLVV